jgi:hypothetical protein
MNPTKHQGWTQVLLKGKSPGVNSGTPEGKVTRGELRYSWRESHQGWTQVVLKGKSPGVNSGTPEGKVTTGELRYSWRESHQGWTQVLLKGKSPGVNSGTPEGKVTRGELRYSWRERSSCFTSGSCRVTRYKPGDKSWKTKKPDGDYIKWSISMVICDQRSLKYLSQWPWPFTLL